MCHTGKQFNIFIKYFINVTRLDTSIVNYLSRFVSCFNKDHWLATKNIFRYPKGISNEINMRILYGTCWNVRLKDFSDSCRRLKHQTFHDWLLVHFGQWWNNLGISSIENGITQYNWSRIHCSVRQKKRCDWNNCYVMAIINVKKRSLLK